MTLGPTPLGPPPRGGVGGIVVTFAPVCLVEGMPRGPLATGTNVLISDKKRKHQLYLIGSGPFHVSSVTQHRVTLNIQGFLLTLPWLPYPWLVEGRASTGSASGQGRRPGPWEPVSPGALHGCTLDPSGYGGCIPDVSLQNLGGDSGLQPRLGTTVPWWAPSGVDCANDVGACLSRGIVLPTSLVLMLHLLCGM